MLRYKYDSLKIADMTGCWLLVLVSLGCVSVSDAGEQCLIWDYEYERIDCPNGYRCCGNSCCPDRPTSFSVGNILGSLVGLCILIVLYRWRSRRAARRAARRGSEHIQIV